MNLNRKKQIWLRNLTLVEFLLPFAYLLSLVILEAVFRAQSRTSESELRIGQFVAFLQYGMILTLFFYVIFLVLDIVLCVIYTKSIMKTSMSIVTRRILLLGVSISTLTVILIPVVSFASDGGLLNDLFVMLVLFYPSAAAMPFHFWKHIWKKEQKSDLLPSDAVALQD